MNLLSDARHTLRQILKAPGFFGTVLVVLSLGIGATTAMFSLVECLLVRPLPYPRPTELSMVWAVQPAVDPSPVSLPDFVDWKAGATSFRTMAAVEYEAFTLTSEGQPPENLRGASVTGEFFPTFELAPMRGRLLGPEDDRQGAPRVCVVSSDLWKRRFSSDPDVVGKTIMLNGVPFTVVGVAAEGFRFGGPYTDRADIWAPLAVTLERYADNLVSGRGSHFLHVLGRRKAGVTVTDASAEVARIASALAASHVDTNTSVGARVEDLHETLVGSSKGGVWTLFAAVGLVFLVVCANVGNLLLGRAEARRGEMAVRAALGATRGRLVAQVMTETVVVFLIGAGLGALLSRFFVGTFATSLVDGPGAATLDVRVDGWALAFAVSASTVSGLAFGLVPALAAANTSPQAVLKATEARAGTSRAQVLVRQGLVVAQVAMAVALLVTSGLALRSFAALVAKSPGFDATDLETTRTFLPAPKYADDARSVRFYEQLSERIAAEPSVLSVGGDSTLPYCGSNSNGSFRIEGRPEFPPGARPLLARNVVLPGYLETMRIPLLEGRTLTADDRAGGRLVMVVSRSVAERFFPGESPIGKRIDWGTEEGEKPVFREIVGVVGDVLRRGLDRPAENEAYVPIAQAPTRWMVMVARTRPGMADSLAQRMPELVRQVDPDQAPAGTRLLSDRIADSVGSRRTLVVMLGAFAASALLLATLGLFGLVSYTTSRRTRELGLRVALGATPSDVVRQVVEGGMRMLGIGLAVGLVLSVAVGRALAARVSGIGSFDPLVFVGVPLVLALSGVLACAIPAVRAVRIPAAVALRYE